MLLLSVKKYKYIVISMSIVVKKSKVGCDFQHSKNKCLIFFQVIINAALYLRHKSGDDSKKKQEVGRLIDALNPSGKGNNVFLRPLHVKLKINSLDHPKADNSKDIILTESAIQVNVSLK